MVAKKGKRIKSVSKDQLEILVKYMEDYPQLANNEIGSNEGRKILWDKLTSILNAQGGAHKPANKWMKCWSDKKNDVRKKAGALKESYTVTEGGQEAVPRLSALEDRIVNIAGWNTAIGDKNVHEAGFKTQLIHPEGSKVNTSLGPSTSAGPSSCASTRPSTSVGPTSAADPSVDPFACASEAICDTPVADWSKEKTEIFIDEYHKRPVLWDKSLKIHNNHKELKDKAYAEIGEIVGESKDSMRKKINNLRSQYLVAHKKIRRKNSEGSESPVSSWWAYNLLSFLSDTISHRKSEIETEPKSPPSSTYIIRINEDMPSVEYLNEEEEIETEPKSPPSSTCIIRINEDMPSVEYLNEEEAEVTEIFSEEHSSSDTDIKPIISKIPVTAPERKRRKTAVSSVTCGEDSYDIYGKYIANEVRAIPDKEQQQLLKLKIQAMIYHAHKGWLKVSDEI